MFQIHGIPNNCLIKLDMDSSVYDSRLTRRFWRLDTDTDCSYCPYPVSGARAGVSVTLGLRPSTGQSDVMWRPRLPAPLPRLSGPSDQLRDWASRAGRGGREQRLVRVSGGRAGHVEWSVDC